MFDMEQEKKEREVEAEKKPADRPTILEEITIEELAVDGICGVY
jgi:mycofactocin precursor